MYQKKMRFKTCCICGRPFCGMGNNPIPVKKYGRCCDVCNAEKVIPERIKEIEEVKRDIRGEEPENPTEDNADDTEPEQVEVLRKYFHSLVDELTDEFLNDCYLLVFNLATENNGIKC